MRQNGRYRLGPILAVRIHYHCHAVLMRLIIGGIALIIMATVIVLIALGLNVTGNATPGWFTAVVDLLLAIGIHTLELFTVLLILASTARAKILRDASKQSQDCIASMEETR